MSLKIAENSFVNLLDKTESTAKVAVEHLKKLQFTIITLTNLPFHILLPTSLHSAPLDTTH